MECAPGMRMDDDVKVARSRDQSEPSWPNAVSLEAGGGITSRPNPAAKLHVVFIIFCVFIPHVYLTVYIK